MVSKLLLAVAENIQRFINEGIPGEQIEKLKSFYSEIHEGIGAHKNPEAYGAIPTDPYSHTPSMLGAQQPGMTGQVKEDIISRWFELGLEIKDGAIEIHRDVVYNQFMQDELSFTFCGTPFKYITGQASGITLLMDNGKEVATSANRIEADYSREIFARTRRVRQVTVVFSS